MRVLIYSETDEAKLLLEAERAKGNHASLRNPDETHFNHDEPEPCDMVHCFDSFIVRAYDGKAEIYYHGPTVSEEQAIEMNGGEDVNAKEVKPAKRPAKKK